MEGGIPAAALPGWLGEPTGRLCPPVPVSSADAGTPSQEPHGLCALDASRYADRESHPRLSEAWRERSELREGDWRRHVVLERRRGLCHHQARETNLR